MHYRPRPGVLPIGVAPGSQSYSFNPMPSLQQRQDWLLQARTLANAERVRLHLLPVVDEDLPALAEELQPVVLPVVASAPVGASALLPAGACGSVGGPCLPASSGGLGALAEALNYGGSDTPPAPMEDARTLPIRFDADGSQYREYRDAVSRCTPSDIPRFVVQGPRTAAWVMRFIGENGGTPLGRHTKFKADARLGSSDAGCSAHEHSCKLLQTALAVDQLDGSNLVSVESKFRRLQTIEYAHGDAARDADARAVGGKMSLEEQSVFLGATRAHSGVMVCPELLSYVREEVERDAKLAKALRMAWEERDEKRKGKGGGRGTEK